MRERAAGAGGAARGAHRHEPVPVQLEPLFLVLPAFAAGALYVECPADPPGGRLAGVLASGLRSSPLPLNSPLETLAAHYLADRAPAPERDARRLGAAAPDPRPDPGCGQRSRAGSAARSSALTDLRVALAIWLAAWYGVHAPARSTTSPSRTGWPLNVEHLILLARGAALLVAGALGRAAPRRSTPWLLGYLGAAFGLSRVPRPRADVLELGAFYGFYEHAPRLWGLSPTKDQNLGGVLMNAEQTLVFLVALGWFFMRLLDEDHARAEEGLRSG